MLPCALLAAPPPPSPDPAPPARTFDEVIDVRVVNVEAVVEERSGKRVRGLGPADFRLLVDGKEVPVEYFTEVAEGKAAAGREGAAPAAGAGEDVGRGYLIFIDDSFSIAANRNAALAGIAADLGRLGAQDRMAVLAFDGRQLDVLCPWTADHAALTAALTAARKRPTGGGQRVAQNDSMRVGDVNLVLEAAEIGEFDPTIVLKAMAERESVETVAQARTTTSALIAALQAFEAPPGRKLMFLISAGWQIYEAPKLYWPVAEAANRLAYTLYPVDTVSLDARPLVALERLAAITGGKVAKSGLRHSAFATAVEDAGTYYWLGFTPAWKGDDRGHILKVEVRRPGLAVRARRSFSDISRGLRTALEAQSRLVFGGQPERRLLRVEVGAPRPAGKGQVEVPVILGVPMASLLVTPDGAGFAAEAPLAIAILDKKGGRAELPASRLRVTFPRAPGSAGYARFRTVLKLRKAPQKIVFTVDDPVAGAVLWGEAEVDPR
jgi:VWFA-related protein